MVNVADCIAGEQLQYKLPDHSPDQVPFLDRAQSKTRESVQVTVAVLSAEETKLIFGLDLYRRGIQPVWLEIENNDESTMRFLPVGLDPEYFAPLEVSYILRNRFAKTANEALDEHYQKLGIGNSIESGKKISGFVFSHLEHGTKVFNVDVIGEDHDLRTFMFVVPVPGQAVEATQIEWDKLYEPEDILSYSRSDLVEALNVLPCCVTDQRGMNQGLPLNVVIVSDADHLVYALTRSGWDLVGRNSSEQESSTPISGTEDYYRPVSIRYVFERPQDVSFRKSRHGGQPNSYLRLWLGPMSIDGISVWVGEVGRDVPSGSKSSARMVDADDARMMLFQDLLLAQTLDYFGAIKRGNALSMPQPYKDQQGRVFIADGIRYVLGLSSEPTALPDVEIMQWESLSWR